MTLFFVGPLSMLSLSLSLLSLAEFRRGYAAEQSCVVVLLLEVVAAFGPAE